MDAHSDNDTGIYRTSPGTPGPVAELLAWIGRLPSISLRRAVPQLLVRLERLHASPLDLGTRYRMARALKGAVLRVAAALPTDLPTSRATLGGFSLEQRLYDAMVRNCKRLLKDMDLDRHGDREFRERGRRWAIRNGFRFIGRQVLCAVQQRRSWPKGLWQDLHDLYAYVVGRGPPSPARVRGRDREFDSEQAYKRLLVVGLVAELLDFRGLDGAVLARLGPMADGCRLVEPDVMVGEYGLTLVEASCDRPARIKSDCLEDSFRGWVLIAPAELETLLLRWDPFQQQAGTAMAA